MLAAFRPFFQGTGNGTVAFNVPISAELPVALQAAAVTTSVTLSFRCRCCYSLLAVTVTGTPIGLSPFRLFRGRGLLRRYDLLARDSWYSNFEW